ncbi:hypothetical protein F511_31614 [Dorcoceras hygrometricum]|uniref:Uncharacterized protein n=1 Tax=Dorcoceras hygrometricum TaxID=472368 RepID=A0A2Z7D7U1_9LAMI|nr:hypothetical protein F511_31614 [Dorcoceras hygrometricum]
MRFYIDSNPSSSTTSTSSDSSPTHNEDFVNNLQMVVYDESREERIDFLDSKNNEGSSHDGSQQVLVSSPPATTHADTKLEAVEKVVVSLDSLMDSMDSTVQDIDSRVKSMDSRLGSLDSKVEQLLNVQTFLKHDFGIYKRGFYDWMETVAANVTSSQTSLEINLVRQLTEQQYQFANDLEFVKMQLVELVNNLKETGDAKKGEG